MQRRDFLKNTSTLGIGALIPSGSLSLGLDFGDGSVTNWAGNVKFTPQKVVTPNTVDEIKSLVKNSSRVKVKGSRHSFNAIAAPSNVWVDLSCLKIAPRFDSASMTVELPGSMILRDANQLLAGWGVAFPSLGEIDEQTIAGLIATSTHGTGLGWGTISDSVRAVKIVTGTGEYYQLRGSDDFMTAVKTHLGVLGAIVSVELDVVPAHHLERVQKFMPINEAADPNLIRANAHTEIYYLPFADVTYVKALNHTQKPSSGLLQKEVGEIFKENFFLDLSLRGASLHPSLVPALLKTVASQFRTQVDSGPSDVMMISRRTMRYHEMELALGLEHVAEALTVVRETIQELAARSQNPFYANLPVSIRAVKGQPGNLLSPTLGCDTVYFSFSSHTAFAGYEDYFRTIEDRFVEKFNARPHWGKHFSISPLSKYEGLAKFKAVRQQFDPDKKFTNPFVDGLFG